MLEAGLQSPDCSFAVQGPEPEEQEVEEMLESVEAASTSNWDILRKAAGMKLAEKPVIDRLQDFLQKLGREHNVEELKSLTKLCAHA